MKHESDSQWARRAVRALLARLMAQALLAIRRGERL